MSFGRGRMVQDGELGLLLWATPTLLPTEYCPGLGVSCARFAAAASVVMRFDLEKALRGAFGKVADPFKSCWVLYAAGPGLRARSDVAGRPQREYPGERLKLERKFIDSSGTVIGPEGQPSTFCCKVFMPKENLAEAVKVGEYSGKYFPTPGESVSASGSGRPLMVNAVKGELVLRVS